MGNRKSKDNKMVKRKLRKKQRSTIKALHVKLKIEKREPNKNACALSGKV